MNVATRDLKTDLQCGACPIRHNAICSRCQAEELLQLEAMKYYVTYQPGDTIVWAGDELSFMGSVVNGAASLSRTLADGRKQMVGLLLPSDFVGRPGREIAPYDVVAATEVLMCQFHRKPFEQMIAQTPSIEGRLLQMTLNELDAAREWMLILGRKTAREKIASLLSIFARRDASVRKEEPGNGQILTLPITREAIADYLGLTIETVSRQITALKKDGVITLQSKREIIIPDYDRLLECAGDDAEF